MELVKVVQTVYHRRDIIVLNLLVHVLIIQIATLVPTLLPTRLHVLFAIWDNIKTLMINPVVKMTIQSQKIYEKASNDMIYIIDRSRLYITQLAAIVLVTTKIRKKKSLLEVTSFSSTAIASSVSARRLGNGSSFSISLPSSSSCNLSDNVRLFPLLSIQ